MPPSGSTKNPHKRQFRHNAFSQTTPSQSPLPSTVQSSLFSLGMRIRKSIPEGYKNQSISRPYMEPVSCNPANHQTSPQLTDSSPPSIHHRTRNPLPLRPPSHMYHSITPAPSKGDLPGLLFANDEEFDLGPVSQDSNTSVTNEQMETVTPLSMARNRNQLGHDFLRSSSRKRAREEDGIENMKTSAC